MMKRTVLKVDIPCRRCKKKILQSVSSLEGIDKIEFDAPKSMLTVTGDADPIRVIVRVRKASKFAQVISIGPLLPPPPPPKPDAQKKADEKKPQGGGGSGGGGGGGGGEKKPGGGGGGGGGQEKKPEQPKAPPAVDLPIPVYVHPSACPICQRMGPDISCSIM